MRLSLDFAAGCGIGVLDFSGPAGFPDVPG
jgi:hypothetical protein